MLTFSDFMASLLAIFILVLIVTLLQLKKQKDELAKQQAEMNIARSELISGLKDIQSQQIKVAKALDGVQGAARFMKRVQHGLRCFRLSHNFRFSDVFEAYGASNCNQFTTVS